jgi:hypothetical protein
MININNIFVVFLIIIFFIYGLVLSEIIDHIFPNYEEIQNDFSMLLEMIGEMGLAYLIYLSLQYYKETLINFLFKKISSKPPAYLNELLLISFSFGIYNHLKKSNNKLIHIRKKFANPIIEKIPFCQFLLIK